MAPKITGAAVATAPALAAVVAGAPPFGAPLEVDGVELVLVLLPPPPPLVEGVAEGDAVGLAPPPEVCMVAWFMPLLVVAWAAAMAARERRVTRENFILI
jgi:hypothetical protein